MQDNKEFKKTLQFKVTKVSIVFLTIFFLGLIYFLFSAPFNNENKEDYIIHVDSSETLGSISKELKTNKIIRSEFFLKSFTFLLKSDKNIKQGDYLFENNSPVFKISWQLSRGKHKIDPIRITLREGLTNEEIADILMSNLSNIDRNKFLELSYLKQGYLFPDTYFFFPLDSSEEVIDKLSENFDSQMSKMKNLMNGSRKNPDEVIIMASIIEKEAKGEKDAYLISGILWKRLKMDMPLQVDASPITYKEIGLPNRSICNPGLFSIKAALKPISSAYLYYLHDKTGQVHFAKDYEEHQKNISEFLK